MTDTRDRERLTAALRTELMRQVGYAAHDPVPGIVSIDGAGGWVDIDLDKLVSVICATDTRDAEIATLTRLLESFVDTDNRCSFDHHGACQSHACGSETGWCANAEALEFLRKGARP